KAAWPARVDEEFGLDLDALAAAHAGEPRAITLEADVLERELVDVAGARGLGFAHEPVVEVGPIPMRVGRRVVRARRDEQLTRVPGIVDELLIEVVLEEAEPALEPAGDFWIRLTPAPPLRERLQAWQVPTISDRFEAQVTERRRRLADREPRM